MLGYPEIEAIGTGGWLPLAEAESLAFWGWSASIFTAPVIDANQVVADIVVTWS